MALLVSGVLLGLSTPGRYLTRERGTTFDTLVGVMAGAGLVAFFFIVLDKRWKLDRLEHFGHLTTTLRMWCGEHGWLCQCLAVLVVLFWLAYWTILPALLAAGVIRLGRALLRRLGGPATPET